MLAVIILQFGHHVQTRMSADGSGIDIVVGAKGSPLQLILSSVYHIDIPTGNIPMKDAQKWMNHPQVRTAIPLALGDNWRGYRIVGTTRGYLEHYGAEITKGRVWNKPFEALTGADIPLGLGKTFSGAHGSVGWRPYYTQMRNYTVVGRLSKTGSILDRLILTSVDSVLLIHGLEGNHDHHEHAEHKHDHADNEDHDHHQHEDRVAQTRKRRKRRMIMLNMPIKNTITTSIITVMPTTMPMRNTIIMSMKITSRIKRINMKKIKLSWAKPRLQRSC